MSTFYEILNSVYPGCVNECWVAREFFDSEIDLTYTETLSEEQVRLGFIDAGLPPHWLHEIQITADIVRSDSRLLGLYALAVQLLINERDKYDARQFKDWPDPLSILGSRAPHFFLLVSIACIPEIKNKHKKLGISDSVTADTCTSIGVKCTDYYFFNKEYGVVKSAMYWFQYPVYGELFRIGRLEYILKPVKNNLFVFRNPLDYRTKLVVKTSENGEWICPTPDGRSLRPAEPKEPLGWHCVLGPGDFVLDLHIPGGGALTLDVIADSFSRAADFFKKEYSDKRIQAFECISWIFSTDLDSVFDNQSNLVRFRDQVYLFPVESRKLEGIPFIFGTSSSDPSTWPEKTGLQERLKSHIIKGGSFRHAGMIYLLEDINRLGQFPYRKQGF